MFKMHKGNSVRGDLKMPKYWRFENDGFSS